MGPKSNEVVRKVATVLNQRMSMLPMVDVQRGEMGYFLLTIKCLLRPDVADEFVDVAQIERSLSHHSLDEYQDTSQSQVRMFSALFGEAHRDGGWRCVSGHLHVARRLWHNAHIRNTCQRGRPSGSQSNTHRNDEIILNLANAIIRSNSVVDVHHLLLAIIVVLANSEIACGIFETMEAEANAIAEYFSDLWFSPERIAKDENERSSFAVLVPQTLADSRY